MAGKPKETAHDKMAWTIVIAGFAVSAFGCLLILIGNSQQMGLVQATFGLGSAFVLSGAGVKADIPKIISSITGKSS